MERQWSILSVTIADLWIAVTFMPIQKIGEAEPLRWVMKSRMMYIENKVTGEAHIGIVTFSRTYRTVYYKEKEFARIPKGGIYGNHYDIKTGEEYWISGPKKRGGDRLYEPTNLIIDDDAREEYERFRNQA